MASITEPCKLDIHEADGTTVVKEVMPKEGAVILEPDVRAYFPDSESVNRTLRCLIPLLPKKLKTKTKKGDFKKILAKVLGRKPIPGDEL